MHQKHISLTLDVSVEKVGTNTHKQELRGIQWFFLIFSLCWVCLHRPVTSSPHTDGERWIVWEEDGSLVNTIILPSVDLGVCEHTLYAVHYVQPHVLLQV